MKRKALYILTGCFVFSMMVSNTAAISIVNAASENTISGNSVSKNRVTKASASKNSASKNSASKNSASKKSISKNSTSKNSVSENSESENSIEDFLPSAGAGRHIDTSNSDGDMDLSGAGLRILPDMSSVTIHGYYNISYNEITKYYGIPKEIFGDFIAIGNKYSLVTVKPPRGVKIHGNFVNTKKAR